MTEKKPEKSTKMHEQVEKRLKNWPAQGGKEPAGSGPGKKSGGNSGNTGAGITTDFVLKCLDANEMGDGVLFAMLHDGCFVANKSSDTWLKWSGHHWRIDFKGECKDAVEAVAAAYVKAGAELVRKIDWALKKNDRGSAEALQLKQKQLYRRVSRLRSEKGRVNCLKFTANNPQNALRIVGDEIDRMPWLLACANGVINLKTGDLEAGRPEDYLLKACPTEWKGVEESCELWERILTEIFGGDQELIDYLQRLFGYGVTGLTREAILPIFHGIGRNGKTLITETIAHVLGPDLARPINGEMLLAQGHARNPGAPSPDIMSLRGARIVFASETDQNRAFSLARVKLLSGGDTLVGRSPHDKFEITFRPSHLLILSTNHVPHAASNDFAFFERVHLVPFKLSFVDREPQNANERRADPQLGDKLKAEASGILAWLVRGCIQWQEMGLCPPEEVRAATRTFQRNEDLLADFIEESCFVNNDSSTCVPAAELYDAYSEWHRENVGKNPVKVQKFGRLMKDKGFEKKKSGKLYYLGLRLLA